MASEPKRVDRRNFIYAGLGAVALVAIGAAAYIAMNPPVVTVTQSTTVPTTSLATTTSVVTTTVPTTSLVTTTVPTTSVITMTEPKPEKLIFQGHEVHRKAAVGANAPGQINLIAQFEEVTGIKVEWVTLANPENYDKLMRECSAAEATINLAHCLTTWWAPRMANLFEQLDPWLEKAPIEEFDDFMPATLQSATIGGKLYGIPVRCSGSTMMYHKGYFEERGATPPKVIDEFYDVAKQVTFTKSTGEKVYGFSSNANVGELYETLTWFARSWDADLITPDYKVVCNQGPVVQALEILVKMYKDGITPPNFTQLQNQDHVNLVKEGRVSLFAQGVSYIITHNDPKTSKVAGQIELGYHPPAAEYKNKWEGTSPTFTYIWSMIIPKNAKYKSWSWELIRFLSSKKSNLILSMQGTDVARTSVYTNEQYLDFWKNSGFPKYPDVLQKVLKYGRPPIPGMDNFSQVAQIIGTKAEEAILGKKTAQQAMDEAAELLKPLMPKV
ncbi:MAG: extracellular solute-binding protein [Nitrososphaeria archaeon]